ncbi:MAG: hypothetical protein GY724_27860 [Actinomycetia bacterium]|nr:hypothetical protein [Actinomycetes bacterium]MCP5030525.1 hypothetical protein [Actinomycetes bacterium]
MDEDGANVESDVDEALKLVPLLQAATPTSATTSPAALHIEILSPFFSG